MRSEESNIKVLNVDEEGRFGGPERRIVNVARGLGEFNVDTIIIIPKLDNERFVAYADAANVQYVICDITRLTFERRILLRFILRFPIEIFTLINLFKKNNGKLVHVNGASQFKVAVAAKLSGKKVVWHLNNTFLKLPVKLLFTFLSKICADGVIYAGFRAGEYYDVERRFRHIPVANIEAPVLPKFFEIKPLLRLGKILRISVIGGVNPAKGLEHVLKVAEILKQSDVRFNISIAGKALASQVTYQRMLDEMLLANGLVEEVTFLGEVTDVIELVENSDVILSMSNREASPTAVWEGLAAGRIVISTDVGSVREHIVDGVNGFIVPVGAAKSAAKIIQNLSDGLYSVTGIAQEGRIVAIRNFSLSRITQQHAEIYERTLWK